MSEELVNQLTLNFLISRTQLQKLNKKIKETADNNRKTDKEIYSERIQTLFSDMLVNQPPEDLLGDVKTGFDFFTDKCIYYFKAKDNHELLEKERSEPEVIIQDDIDFDKEERDIEKGDYEEEGEEEDNKLYDEIYSEEKNKFDEKVFRSKIQIGNFIESTNKIDNNVPINVRQKHKKINNSVGVDDMQKLPLDWFQSVRQNYKKNNIIPRTKDK
jgi:hypothetical protein